MRQGNNVHRHFSEGKEKGERVKSLKYLRASLLNFNQKAWRHRFIRKCLRNTHLSVEQLFEWNSVPMPHRTNAANNHLVKPKSMQHVLLGCLRFCKDFVVAQSVYTRRTATAAGKTLLRVGKSKRAQGERIRRGAIRLSPCLQRNSIVYAVFVLIEFDTWHPLCYYYSHTPSLCVSLSL